MYAALLLMSPALGADPGVIQVGGWGLGPRTTQPEVAPGRPPRPRVAIREADTPLRPACSIRLRRGTVRSHPGIAVHRLPPAPRHPRQNRLQPQRRQHVVTRVLLAGTAIVLICSTRSRHAVTPGSRPTAAPRIRVPPPEHRRQRPLFHRRRCPSPRIRRGMKNCRVSRRYQGRESPIRVAPTDHSSVSTQVPPTGFPTAKTDRRFF